MLVVETPPGFGVTLRTPSIYLVPRRHGAQAGRMLIGATVESCGFDKTVHPAALNDLLEQAAEFVPSLAEARVVDSWAGLRPGTTDGLPLIGPHPTRAHHFVASGHYRNGILLAPATAMLVADLVEQRSPVLDLGPFLPDRLMMR